MRKNPENDRIRHASAVHEMKMLITFFNYLEIRDDFALRNIAFRQKAYKVDKDLSVLE